MSTDSRAYITSTLRKLLASLVRIMLRNGMTYREFCDVSKEMFVEVATKDYGIRGRDTNVSRVSVLTGIDRKEVKRVKDCLQGHALVNQSQSKQDRVTRVLSAWHKVDEYLDDSGRPMVLALEGATSSFAQLAKSYAGDVPVRALLKEMIRVGVVEEVDKSQVKVLKREFIPAQSDPDALLRAGSVLHDMGATLCHNLYDGGTPKKPLRFERRASNRNLDPEQLKAFREFVAQEGQAFLEVIDDWLSDHELSDDENNRLSIRAGVGTYAFEELIEQPDDEPSIKGHSEGDPNLVTNKPN